MRKREGIKSCNEEGKAQTETKYTHKKKSEKRNERKRRFLFSKEIAIVGSSHKVEKKRRREGRKEKESKSGRQKLIGTISFGQTSIRQASAAQQTFAQRANVDVGTGKVRTR